jgi:two-component system cell cycle sensor histidine kinase/response regulator CckA
MRLPDLLARRFDGGAIAESLFDDEADGVALLDRQGGVLRANARFAGLPASSAGQLAWDALPQAVAASLRAALQDGRAATSTVTMMQAGARHVLRLALLPVAERGALLRVSDHTHEHDLEDQLCQAQRLQAVGELAGGIAHDFNNLLTAIMGAADDLSARGVGGAAALEDLGQIRQSAERGADLVRHLLAFSRQQTLQPKVIALNDAVRDAYGLLHRLLGAGVSLTLELEEPGRLVCMDPTQLTQVLMNLAVNARHAMPGGGRLTIASGHRLVLRPEPFGGDLVPAGRYATLRVADTGAGIPPDVLPRIFEPFFTTRREAGGTGLGLSTVHGIVRQTGGYMAVESAPGAGTCFDILLPRHEASWQAEPPPPPAAPRRAASRTVLLVDDEAPVRRLAERVLTRAGWNVVVAPCGEDALELVEGGELGPALGCVISDVVMPGMDGPALVAHLRRTWPELPAILMSGYADATLRRALASADIAFLAKPFGMADLTRALGALVDRAA